MNNKKEGKFIVFEGLDGSGQSSQAELLKQYLTQKQYFVVLTKEPTSENKEGKQARDILQGKIQKEARELQELFIEDRKKHLDYLIKPALKQNKIIISDRYFFSTIAFGGLDMNIDELIYLNQNFLLPDITFFLDVTPEICLKRILKRGEKTELFEKQKKLEKVYQNYKLCFKNFENIYFINGEQSKKEVSKEIKKIYNNL